MFDNCYYVTNLDVSGWKNDQITDMTAMFKWLKSLETLNLKNFDTSSVSNMSSMFENSKFTILDFPYYKNLLIHYFQL